jgi:2-octaprenyl-6-methoxyphenol hydroxylase
LVVRDALTEETFDIAVVGAGAVGLSAALAFARDGYRTALVGGLDVRRDGRTVALLNGSIRFLDAVGAWPALRDVSAPLETMRIIDDTGSLFRPPPVAFSAGEIGLDAFGWNIENATLVEGLADKAKRQDNLTLVRSRQPPSRRAVPPPSCRSRTDRSCVPGWLWRRMGATRCFAIAPGSR